MALDGSSSVGLLVVQLEGSSELEQANCMVCTELGYVSVLHGIKEWSDDSEVKAQKEYLEKLHICLALPLHLPVFSSCERIKH